jgi:hypothetical protein
MNNRIELQRSTKARTKMNVNNLCREHFSNINYYQKTSEAGNFGRVPFPQDIKLHLDFITRHVDK